MVNVNEQYSTRYICNKHYIYNSSSIMELKPKMIFHKKFNVKNNVIDMKVKEIRTGNYYNKLTHNTQHNKTSNNKNQYILKFKHNKNNISHMNEISN